MRDPKDCPHWPDACPTECHCECDYDIDELRRELMQAHTVIAAILATTGPVNVPWTYLKTAGINSTISSLEDSIKGATLYWASL